MQTIQHQLRDRVWPYYSNWENWQAVRDYLKQKWVQAVNPPVTPDLNEETVRREMMAILKVQFAILSSISLTACILLTQWWWNRSPYRQQPLNIKEDYFGQWLLSQYRDHYKLDQANNKSGARFF